MLGVNSAEANGLGVNGPRPPILTFVPTNGRDAW